MFSHVHNVAFTVTLHLDMRSLLDDAAFGHEYFR